MDAATGVDHKRHTRVTADPHALAGVGDRFDDLAGGEHPRFDGVHTHVVDDGLDLARHDVGRDVGPVVHTEGVLHGHRRDGHESVHTTRDESA